MTNEQFEALKNETPCTRCNGAGVIHNQWAKDHGHEGPEGRKCNSCEGTGMFAGLDISKIMELITAGKGEKKRFRASWPSKFNPWRTKDVTVRRAYYVWRLARFHGGADVTMPMTASMVVTGDPCIKALDLMSDAVARKVFKTDMAAAARWGRLFGRPVNIEGLPASAYEGGPVVPEGGKPDFELAELG